MTELKEIPFVGREEELNDLVEAFANTILSYKKGREANFLPVKLIKLSVIHGGMFVGKTRFAVETAKKLVKFIDAQEVDIIVHMVELEGLKDLRDVQAKMASSMLKHPLLSLTPNDKWQLFIFDKADGFAGSSTLDAFLTLCQDVISGEARVLLIITSTVKFDFIRIANQVKQTSLNPLSYDQSKHLLYAIAPNARPLNEDGKEMTRNVNYDIDDIIRHSNGIPHMIALAGAEIRDGRRSVEEIAADLRRKASRKRKRDDSGIDCDNELDSYSNQAKVNAGAYVENLPPSLKKKLAKMSFIPGSFTMEAAAYITAPGPDQSCMNMSDDDSNRTHSTALAKRDMLIPLHRRSLIAFETLSNRFTILSFLRLYLEERYSLLLEPAETCAVRGRYCGFYARLLQQAAELLERDDACKSIPIFMAELQNMQKLLQEVIHCPEESYDLFIEVAHQARTLILLFIPNNDAISFYQACLEAAERRKDKYQQARMLIALGRLKRYVKGNMEDAESHYKEALGLLAPYGDSLDHANARVMLGFHFFDSAKPKLALSYQYEALEMIERLESTHELQNDSNRSDPLEEHDGEVEDHGKGLSFEMQLTRLKAQVLEEMACVHGRLNGQPSEALECHQRSITLQRMLWRDHLQIGENYFCMALVYHNIGSRDMARKCAEQALNIIDRLCTQPCPKLIVCYVIVATVFFESKGIKGSNDDDKVFALALIDRAWKVQERLKTHNILEYCLLYAHAKMVARKGDYARAREMFARGYTMAYPILKKHLNTARALQAEGWSALQLSDYDGAVQVLLQCLEMRQEALRTMRWNVEIAETYETLGDTFALQGGQSRLVALMLYDRCYQALAIPIKCYRDRKAYAAVEVEELQNLIARKIEIVSVSQSEWSEDDHKLMRQTAIYEYNYWPMT